VRDLDGDEMPAALPEVEARPGLFALVDGEAAWER
jgi:hypothetical protein